MFEDDLLALERKVLTDSAGDFSSPSPSSGHARSVAGLAQKLIQLAIPQVEAAAKAGYPGGVRARRRLGARHSPQCGQACGGQGEAGDQGPARLAHAPADRPRRAPADAKKAAVLLVRNGASIEAALAPIFGAATTVRSRVETQINAASNTASMTVGKRREDADGVGGRTRRLRVLPRPRRPRRETPATRSRWSPYGVVPKSSAVVAAPLHPHCRCRLAVLVDQSYADALKREAQRSVLRGFALPSESNAVRVNAARSCSRRSGRPEVGEGVRGDYFQHPFTNPDLADGFGSTGYWEGGKYIHRPTPHRGLDYPQPGGTPIPATAGGKVVRVFLDDELGHVTVIEHHRGANDPIVFSGYCHQSAVEVKVDDIVTRGHIIGKVGKTGTAAAGNHLHFTMSHYPTGVEGPPANFNPATFIDQNDKASLASPVSPMVTGSKAKYVKAKTGDYLTKIANAAGISLSTIKKLNPDIKGPSFILRPGDKIRVH
jgi:murein DD-endopeptidase MepM/ murein hydrolase activator NlpD